MAQATAGDIFKAFWLMPDMAISATNFRFMCHPSSFNILDFLRMTLAAKSIIYLWIGNNSIVRSQQGCQYPADKDKEKKNISDSSNHS